MTPEPSIRQELSPGTEIDGRFRIEQCLGVGGFGAVYRAKQLMLDREVALKILHTELLASAVGVKRFWREAQLVQRLEHPNTVKLYDFGQTTQGLLYIVFQLLRGRSLYGALCEDGPMPPDRVAHVASQVLKSLMEAHSVGIVHRDIKPENIFLVDFAGEPDFVKVLDFGVAKTITHASRSGVSLTMAGETLGTPQYMAPEQVRAKDLEPAADLYSLGLVMAEMLTGQAVFGGLAPLDAAYAQISDESVPLDPEVLGGPLGQVIARATQKSPRDRFASASEMLDAIGKATKSRWAPAAPTPVVEPPFRDSSPTIPAPSPSELTEFGDEAPTAVLAALSDGSEVSRRPPRRSRRRLLILLLVVIGGIGLSVGIAFGGILAIKLLDLLGR